MTQICIFANGHKTNDMAHSVYKYRTGEAYPHCYKYPQAAITADCVIFSYDGKDLLVLLVKRGLEPFKDSWALPGGFIRPNETVEEGAKRELFEETSLRAEYMEQIRVFSDPDRDPRQRVVTVPFFALVKHSEGVGGDDAAEARWFPVDKVPDLAFDHAQILAVARESLKHSLYFNPVSFDLLPEQFTMPQLQRLYELILGRKFDRRNFARKMKALDILNEQGVVTSDAFDISNSCSVFLEESAPVCEPVMGAADVKKRPSGTPSRIASIFSFNKKKWSSMKSEGDTNFEF